MGAGWLPFTPLEITAGVDVGYDDNATISANAEGSSFARENVVLTYDRPGQHNAIGGQNLLGPARHDDAIANPDIGGGALAGLRRRAQIAGPVIDDRDCHYRLPLSVPFVEGTAPARRGSISIA